MSAQVESPHLAESEEPQDGGMVVPDTITRSQAFNLYTSHFLSTWNIRTYEFATVSISDLTMAIVHA